jgi:hypothetical protein
VTGPLTGDPGNGSMCLERSSRLGLEHTAGQNWVTREAHGAMKDVARSRETRTAPPQRYSSKKRKALVWAYNPGIAGQTSSAAPVTKGKVESDRYPCAKFILRRGRRKMPVPL